MKISKFIEMLQKVYEESGDIEIRKFNDMDYWYYEPQLVYKKAKPHVDYIGKEDKAYILCPVNKRWLGEYQSKFDKQEAIDVVVIDY